MARGFAYWIAIFLLFSMLCNGKSDMEASEKGYFTLNDIYVGKQLAIKFNFKDMSSLPKLLPKQEADSIPFSSSQLPYLLKLFSIPPNSPQAVAMKETLVDCETKPLKGVTKFCATSLESLLDHAREAFGLEAQIKVLSTTRSSKKQSTNKYTILEASEMPSSKMMACHGLPYPYAVYFCHYQESETKVFKMLLGDENGDHVDAPAVCHMDTSVWSPQHIAFRLLGTKHGSPVCHFFPSDNLVWYRSNADI